MVASVNLRRYWVHTYGRNPFVAVQDGEVVNIVVSVLNGMIVKAYSWFKLYIYECERHTLRDMWCSSHVLCVTR